MTRLDIISEARQWVGTKWQHQAYVKGHACDCIGLVRGVFEKFIGKVTFPDWNYPATWHLFKQEERMKNEVAKYLKEVPIEEAKPGDVLLFGLERGPAHHAAIKTGDKTMIHSYRDVGKVIEQEITDKWAKRIRFAFRYPEVEE